MARILVIVAAVMVPALAFLTYWDDIMAFRDNKEVGVAEASEQPSTPNPIARRATANLVATSTAIVARPIPPGSL